MDGALEVAKEVAEATKNGSDEVAIARLMVRMCASQLASAAVACILLHPAQMPRPL